ncbi:interleukin-10 [Scleropages formosus]|uniref:Interleukin family protein n=1 Tax=Scleropages formosus TaxID=113540 RepID=A0A8C9QWQ4_SCLFO|nr:interleukin-10 [Scleropages formosus]
MFFSSLTCVPLCTVALLLVASAQSRHCTDSCCSFVENFPARLKQLRVSFDEIKQYYQENDELEMALLDENILQEFKSPFGCQAMNEVLRFYLDIVLPTATQKVRQDYSKPIDIIGNIFLDLKKQVIQCRNFFSCKKHLSLDSIMTTYKKMQNKGLYKAMGELDVLFNYIEEYMVSKRKRH